MDIINNRADLPMMPDNQVPPPVPVAMLTLQDEIDRVYVSLEKMIDKIKPIMGPEHDSKASPPENPMAKNSPLAADITDQAGRIRNLRWGVESIIERIEL